MHHMNTFFIQVKNLVKQSLKSKKIPCIYSENVTGINYTTVNLTIFLVSAME